jgi:hypothetical protein
LNVFIWNGPKAEAMRGYNDDLVMSMGIGLWVRETALRLRNDQIAYNRQMLAGISKVSSVQKSPILSKPFGSPTEGWDFNPNTNINSKKESLTWLL